MTEKCKTCKNEFDSGIWMSPQFRDEKVLLFCSEKCKKDYIKMKLNRIKVSYPKYYEKVMKGEVKDWRGWEEKRSTNVYDTNPTNPETIPPSLACLFNYFLIIT